jgi:hypothetical protein
MAAEFSRLQVSSDISMKNLRMLGKLLPGQVYFACISLATFFYLVNLGVVGAIIDLF